MPSSVGRILEKENGISELHIHFDNDKAGRSAAFSLAMQADERLTVYADRAPCGKDWNDSLLEMYPAQRKEKTIKENRTVLLCEPGRPASISDMELTLENMQKFVGGYIEEYCPFGDSAAIICAEEGKLQGKEFNRAVRSEKDGKILDFICGPFIVAGIKGEEFTGLSDKQLEKYRSMFMEPQEFFTEMMDERHGPAIPENER